MPNGGSDCCGTCNFNRKNRGVAGYGGRDNPEPPHCEIRGFPIRTPFYTYCANHPHHNPDRIQVPIGPVYEGEERDVLHPAPDSPAVRDEMLRLLEEATLDAARHYPAGRSLTEAAVLQVGEFLEWRGLPHLDRLRALRDDGSTTHNRAFGDPAARFVTLATAALERLLPPQSLAAFRTETVLGLAEGIRAGGHFDRLAILADALEEAGYSMPEVLAYLRTNPPGPNWVVDVLTGPVQ
jgi:hypothetical protein